MLQSREESVRLPPIRSMLQGEPYDEDKSIRSLYLNDPVSRPSPYSYHKGSLGSKDLFMHEHSILSDPYNDFDTSKNRTLNQPRKRPLISSYLFSKDKLPKLKPSVLPSPLDDDHHSHNDSGKLRRLPLPDLGADPSRLSSHSRSQSDSSWPFSESVGEGSRRGSIMIDNYVHRRTVSEDVDSSRGFHSYRSHQTKPYERAGKSTNSGRYVCPYCQKKFSRPSSLRIHTYSHTGEKPFVCPEEECGRRFSVQSNMRRHLRVHEIKHTESP